MDPKGGPTLHSMQLVLRSKSRNCTKAQAKDFAIKQRLWNDPLDKGETSVIIFKYALPTGLQICEYRCSLEA